MPRTQGTAADIESPYAWLRLWLSLLLMTIGGSGMYSMLSLIHISEPTRPY